MNEATMRTLALVDGWRGVENRSWGTAPAYRGQVAIHASRRTSVLGRQIQVVAGCVPAQNG